MTVTKADLEQRFREAVSHGELVVIPTDTVYGIGSDPWSKQVVSRLLGAKGRDETMPPPVLVPNPESIEELAKFEGKAQLDRALLLAHAFWPGPLTMIVRAALQFGWDMTAKGQTVALRMPDQDLTLELLRAVGPLAVTSANRTGMPPALSVTEAQDYFGDEVSVYVDGGPAQTGVPSTIVDLTGEKMRVLREGTVGLDQLKAVTKER